MRIKYYVRGVGIGILFATIILTVSHMIRGGNELSESEIIAEAKKLGMVFEDPETGVGKETGDTEVTGTESIEMETAGTENTVTNAEGIENTDTENVETQIAETPTSEVEGGAETGAATAGGIVSADAAAPAQNESIMVQVFYGTTWRDIANLLYQEGIIADTEDFWKYVYRNAGGRMLREGEYAVPRGAGYDDIIKIITE